MEGRVNSIPSLEKAVQFHTDLREIHAQLPAAHPAFSLTQVRQRQYDPYTQLQGDDMPLPFTIYIIDCRYGDDIGSAELYRLSRNSRKAPRIASLQSPSDISIALMVTPGNE